MKIDIIQREDKTKNCRIIKENLVYLYSVDRDGKTTVQINFYDTEGKPEKTLQLHKGYDFIFKAISFEEEQKDIVQFDMDKDNLLYSPLKMFLENGDSLDIDDDHTGENLKKFMTIENKEENVSVKFRNDTDNKDLEKFNVFVKNIFYDERSKINQQGLSTKFKLILIFSAIEKIFAEKIKSAEKENDLLKYINDGEER